MSLIIPVDPGRARLWTVGLADSASLLTSAKSHSSALYIVRLSDGLGGTFSLLRELSARIMDNPEDVELIVWRSHTVLVERWSREMGGLITSRDSSGWRWAIRGADTIRNSRLVKLALCRYAPNYLPT